ncbi:SpoIIE family protein phosphatase [Conexibacter sp. W3-3-2]|uniref:PP2C family protein-serine/threonine phosphatase n=1 Tax=Conexibacter sp. W3-3-2 TaxID=2675227 RepID=UPI0012B769B5|nr:protein phosphatase 2C domain-containing protein [Conexibacter sp. W3-3-2]MTD44616.1 SpoIIE family protein phosphatase [Conexibacter sp. W3-3-2]
MAILPHALTPRTPPAPGTTPLRVVAHGARSVRGLRRMRNEDAVLLASPLLAVADGVGGHVGGDDASALTVAALRRAVPDGAVRDPEDALLDALDEANAAVRAAARSRRVEGMASTVVAALLTAEGVTVAHAGDSRAYLWHDGRLERLTDDHSLVAVLEAREQITEDEARRHPLRSSILRAIGLDDELRADVDTVPVAPGDVLVLCTDGISDQLTDAEIADVLASTADPDEACDVLVALARETGGDDTTVVVAQLG